MGDGIAADYIVGLGFFIVFLRFPSPSISRREFRGIKSGDVHLQLREISFPCYVTRLIRTANNIQADCNVGLEFRAVFPSRSLLSHFLSRRYRDANVARLKEQTLHFVIT